MYVNPILIGVVGTILVELGCIIVYSVFKKDAEEWRKINEDKQDSGNE